MTLEEKIIKLYLLDKYKFKTDISKFLKISQAYVVEVIKKFNENTHMSDDLGICQSTKYPHVFYLFSPSGQEKTLFLLDNEVYSESPLTLTEKNFIENNIGYGVRKNKESLFQLLRQRGYNAKQIDELY
tara:strand:+ start:1058 stop:1444 length:387 start_codon:yes stop_codon:yes gene_type:complete